MMGKLKKTAVVTGGTKNQFPAMAVLALNIADKCPNIADELVIFHDGVPIEEQRKVQKIFPTRFIEYTSPFNNTESCFSDNVTKYFSLMVFCKYECFRLLEEYSTVIWCDYDTVINKDIAYISKKENTSCKFLLHDYIQPKFLNKFYFDSEYNFVVDSIDFNKKGICCCFFILYDDFPNYMLFYNNCLSETNKLASFLDLPEEAIISILLQKYNIHCNLIDKDFIVGPKIFINDNNHDIFHSVGQPKFWNGLYNEKWNNYYCEWVDNYKGMEFVQNKQKKNIIKKIIKCILPYGIVRLIQKNRK